MLKQIFRQNKKLQKKFMLLFNILNNKSNDFINSSNKKDVIYYRQTWNTTSLQRPDIKKTKIAKEGALSRNRVFNHSKIKEKTLKKNKVVNYTDIKKKTMGKNSVADHFKIEKNI